jgi:1-deoxyxylulose-5-phosphate synthase
MKYNTIKGLDTRCSQLGIGTLHFGVYLGQKEVNHIIHAAIDRGINFFETAPMYGNGTSEQLIGKAIEGKNVIVSTKAGLEPVKTSGKFAVQKAQLTAKYITQSVESSLKNMNRDTIDLFQLHAFDNSTPIEETKKALDSLIKEGKISALGCSNYSPDELDYAKDSGLDFSTVQFHYNLLERRAGNSLIPLINQQESQALCNRALARGLLSGQYTTVKKIPVNSRAAKSERIRETINHRIVEVINALKNLASDWHISCAQLAVRWVFAHNIIPFIGIRSKKQLEQCCEAAENSLSNEQIRAVNQILKHYHYLETANSQPEQYLEL